MIVSMCHIYGLDVLNTTASFVILPLLFLFKFLRMVDTLNRHYFHLVVLQNTDFSIFDEMVMNCLQIDVGSDTASSYSEVTVVSFEESASETTRTKKTILAMLCFIIGIGLLCGVFPCYFIGISTEIPQMNWIYFFASFLIFIFTSICLTNDEYHIKYELIASVIVIFIFGILLGFLEFVIKQTIWISSLMLYKWIILGIFESFVMLVCPLLYVAISRSNQNKIGNQTATQTTLDNIFHNPKTYRDFRTSVAQDFCVENVLFLEALDRLKYAPRAEQYGLTNHIIKLFIKSDADLELNIPMQIKRNVFKQIRMDHSYAIFMEAEAHVKQLLVCNNLPRFLAKFKK